MASLHNRDVDAVAFVALSSGLPDIVLKEYRHWTSITFRGRGFAWVDHQEDTAMVKSTHAEREAIIGSDPETFSAGWASRSTAWVSIELAGPMRRRCSRSSPTPGG